MEGDQRLPAAPPGADAGADLLRLTQDTLAASVRGDAGGWRRRLVRRLLFRWQTANSTPIGRVSRLLQPLAKRS